MSSVKCLFSEVLSDMRQINANKMEINQLELRVQCSLKFISYVIGNVFGNDTATIQAISAPQKARRCGYAK